MWLIGGGDVSVVLHCLFISTGSEWPHSVPWRGIISSHHIICYFTDCKSLLVAIQTHLSSTNATV